MGRHSVSGGVAAVLGFALFLAVGCAGTDIPDPEQDIPTPTESPESVETEKPRNEEGDGGAPDSGNPEQTTGGTPPSDLSPAGPLVDVSPGVEETEPVAVDVSPPAGSPAEGQYVTPLGAVPPAAAGVEGAPLGERPVAPVAEASSAPEAPPSETVTGKPVDRKVDEGPSEFPVIPGDSEEKSAEAAAVVVAPATTVAPAAGDSGEVAAANGGATPIYPNPLLDDARPVPGYRPAPVAVAPPQRTPIPPPAEPAQREMPEPPAPPPVVVTEAPARYLPGPGELTVVLEGSGWILRSDLIDTGSWRFLGRETGGGRTRFTFEFPETGDWDLVFERQDVAVGASERTFRRIVVEESAGEAGRAAADPATEIPDDPEYRASMARTAWEEGRHDEAVALWETDAKRRDSYGVDARRSLVSAAAASGDAGTLSTWLPAYLDDEVSEDILVSAWTALDRQAGYTAAAMPVLRRLAEIDESNRRPEWLYRWAYALEQPGSSRDLDTAKLLYIEVVEDWPLSDWRYLSEERLQWLDRHYFRVR